MEQVVSLIAAIIKYGNYAIQFEGMVEEALPKIIENLKLAYSLLLRQEPITAEEKAKVIAAEDEIHQILANDFAQREAEAAELAKSATETGTDLSGR